MLQTLLKEAAPESRLPVQPHGRADLPVSYYLDPWPIASLRLPYQSRSGVLLPLPVQLTVQAALPKWQKRAMLSRRPKYYSEKPLVF